MYISESLVLVKFIVARHFFVLIRNEGLEDKNRAARNLTGFVIYTLTPQTPLSTRYQIRDKDRRKHLTRPVQKRKRTQQQLFSAVINSALGSLFTWS